MVITINLPEKIVNENSQVISQFQTGTKEEALRTVDHVRICPVPVVKMRHSVPFDEVAYIVAVSFSCFHGAPLQIVRCRIVDLTLNSLFIFI